MIELNNEKCHNFEMANKLGRCPFISVCNSDCVFVWKHYYDSKESIEAKDYELDELQDKIYDLERDIDNLESEKDDAESTAECFEEKYKDVISDLARVINKESIDKLQSYAEDGCIEQEWVTELETEWEIKNR